MGSVAQAGDGGTATVNARDQLDRETIAALQKNNERLFAENEGLKEQLEQTVTSLGRIGAEQGRSEASINEAKRALARGEPEQAEKVYLNFAQRKRGEGSEALKEAAEAYRSLGALAFLHDTEAALGHYREATQLDPENPEGWNQLGHLQRRVGDLEEAESAYGRVLELADSTGQVSLKAIAYGNLGIVYRTRGELDWAVEMHEKSLAIEEALGRKEGMAINYGNLGNVYQTRGELDRAVEMYEKSLAIEEALGRWPATTATSGSSTRGDCGKQSHVVHNMNPFMLSSGSCRAGW